MTPVILPRALPAGVIATLEADYHEALDDLEKAVEAYEDADFFGPDQEGRMDFSTLDEMAEAASRVLRLARMRP